MDWEECLKSKIVKEVKEDVNLIKSLRETAKIKSAETLPEELFIGKISLMYDALREYLESLALENGYKVYNHECYASFLKEILELSALGDKFDRLRRIRNAINYYGKRISREEAGEILAEMNVLIEKIKVIIKQI